MYIPFYAMRKYQSALAYLENIWKNVKWLPKISQISTKTLNFHEYDISTLFISFPFDCTQARNVEADHP